MKRWFTWSLGLVVAFGSIGQVPVTTASDTVMDTKVPALSYAFNDSPEHKAIVKMLRDTGEDQLLETANSVAMSKGKDFAYMNISYSRHDEPAEAELFLFKEDDAWVAYRELPTQKDHSAIFSTLARRYCMPRYKYLQSASLIDDTWQSKNPQKRVINIVCSELINNQWKNHRLTFVFEYDDEQGWHITGESDTRQPSVKVIWGNAREAVEQILQFIGSNPKPVFIMFGTTGQNFIQFHYVTENGSKDIQTVEWLNGKLRGPKASRLARPCPPIPLEELNFDLVSIIFEDMGKKAKPEDMINVNMSRRFANGCQEPMWQGIATSANHSLTVTYSIDGRQTDIKEYSF